MSFPNVVEAVTQVRRRADMENSQFVDDEEIVSLMNDNLEIIYNTCVSTYGETVYVSSAVIGPLPNPGSSGVATVWPNMTYGIGSPVPTRYDLPADFQSLIRAEWCSGNVITWFDGFGTSIGTEQRISQPNYSWVPMHPFDITGSTFDSNPKDWLQGQVAYWITASPTFPNSDIGESGGSDFQIAFLPVPKATVTVHIQYLPKAPQFDTGYQIKMPVLAWKYVREATAADILDKQRSDSSALRMNAEKYRLDVINTPLRPDDANPPQTVEINGGSGLPNHGSRRTVW